MFPVSSANWLVEETSAQVSGCDTTGTWKLLSHVRLFATPRTIQSMEFSRPEYWSA